MTRSIGYPLGKLRLLGTFLALILLVGCASEEDKWGQLLTQQSRLTNSKLTNLNDLLQAKRVPNAQLIQQYAQVLTRQQPSMAELITMLAKDGGVDGPLFSSLRQRLDTADRQVAGAPQQGKSAADALFQEFAAITAAADPQNYNMMLSDPLNVLADLSNGSLPRVASLSKEANAQINNSTENYPGEQLVGNPQYGQWQTNSSGSSFWAWYGAYRLFGDMFDNRRIGYDGWSRNRGYSYYNDYGRDSYTSPKQYQQQQSVETSTKKKFQASGKSFTSPYAKTRTGPAQAASVASAAKGSAAFRSSYSASSNAKSSSRNASKSTSRSSFSSK